MDLYTEKLMPALAEGAAKAERSVDDIDRMIEIKISYDTDPEAALENTRFWAPLSLTAEQKHSIEDPIEMEAAADALPIEQVAKRWIVASDPDDAVARIQPYVDAGLNHLVFHAPGHDQRRFLELFERDLLRGCARWADALGLNMPPRAARLRDYGSNLGCLRPHVERLHRFPGG